MLTSTPTFLLAPLRPTNAHADAGAGSGFSVLGLGLLSKRPFVSLSPVLTLDGQC